MICTPDRCNVSQEDVLQVERACKLLVKPKRVGVTYSFRDWDTAMVLQNTVPLKDDVVLDVGCGESAFIFFIADYVSKVYGIDNASFNNYADWYATLGEYTDYQSAKVEVITQNAKELPFADNFFDKVFTFSALEHFLDDEDTLCTREVFRVLKPGGTFSGTVDFNILSEWPLNDDFCRTYTYESFFRRIVEPAGFKLLGEPRYIDPIPTEVSYIAAPLFFALVKT